jgi:hypothetical protein
MCDIEANLDIETKKELDKIYKELEKRIDDYELQEYISPLLSPDSFTIEKVEHLRKFLDYYKDEGVFLPLIDDPRYKTIRNYKEYEFTNCIAYEMVIRTDEFLKYKYLTMTIDWTCYNKWYKKIRKDR